jgi:hypothetical protein
MPIANSSPYGHFRASTFVREHMLQGSCGRTIVSLRYIPAIIEGIKRILLNILHPSTAGLDFSGATIFIGTSIIVISLIPYIISVYLVVKCMELYLFKNRNEQ